MSTSLTPEQMKNIVRDHFEEFVNKRNAGVIRKNMTPDFADHDGPGGKPTGVDGDEQMMLGMYKWLQTISGYVHVYRGSGQIQRREWVAQLAGCPKPNLGWRERRNRKRHGLFVGHGTSSVPREGVAPGGAGLSAGAVRRLAIRIARRVTYMGCCGCKS